MRLVPTTCLRVLAVCAPGCLTPIWPSVNVLSPGALLAPGRRTVTAVLRVRGVSAAPPFQRSHRVLNRAVWSPLRARRLRLRRFVARFVPWGVVVCGRDDTIARRRGDHMRAPRLSRDPEQLSA